MVREFGGFGSVAGVLVAGAATVAPAFAALPPYWQSAREISTIVNDPRVHDALKYEEPILSVTAIGDDVYELKTTRCKVMVTIVSLPPKEGMVGPQAFDLQIGQAECQ